LSTLQPKTGSWDGEARYRLLVDLIPDVLWVLDLETRKFTYVSPSVEQLLGYTVEEALARSMDDVLTAESREQISSALPARLEAFLAGNPAALYQITELEQTRKDGSTMWAELKTRLIHDGGGGIKILGVSRDITARKQAEEALRGLEHRYSSLFENMLEGFAHCRMLYDEHGRPADFVYLDVNAAFGRLTGLQNVLDRKVSDVVPGIRESSPELFEAYGRVARTGTPERFEFDFKSLKQWLSISVYSPARNHFVAVFQDITAQKELEAQLRHSQKMEAVGRLAGGVAHDFNNMLAVILGFGELAQQSVRPDDPVQSHLTEIVQAARRSAELTKQLLAFARKQAVAPRIVNLNTTLESLQKMMSRLVGEDIAVRVVPGPNLGSVRIDPAQVDHIVTNLVANARDAITDVGTITLETSNVHVTPDGEWGEGTVSGDYVALAVSDSGAGMDAATKEHIFEPFFTTKEQGKGTGLGLATVYGIIRQNGGFIDVESEPGAGTKFTINLPRCAGSGEHPAETENPDARTGSETVLVVEDEPQVLDLAKKSLGRRGYTVLTAASPADAIAICREHAGEIHVVVSDVVMPSMNGRDLNARLREIRPNIRTVFMSGYTANIIADRGLMEDGILFLQKPFTLDALALKVREALGSWRAPGRGKTEPAPEWSH
jgi:two-component system, cell cycle sensor histidine kinase and response regulator CckA